MMLSQGDSATILVNSDSIFSKGQERPPFIKEHDHIKYHVKMIEVLTKEEYLKSMQAEQEEQMKKDDDVLQKYIKEKGLNVQKTPSGLYYVIEKEGAGELATPGKTVSVHYTGTLLDGTKFDSSVDRGQPFEFVLGQGRVIRGWDEGIALLKKGAKAKLLIPSSMAYGSRSAGTIPANSPLIFDVELLDIK
jgi:FKBP-type peptidyl-prolyl cis-trans isomerase FkpA